MASIFDYSQTPASNTALFPENQAPSSLNDSARQVQADIAGGVLKVYTTGGSADAYTVTLSPAISTYSTTADLSFMAKIHTANLTTTPTVNVNALGAKTIKDRAGAALVAGALPTGCVVKLWYDGTDFRAVDVGGGALSGTSLSLSGSLSVGTTTTLTGTVTGPSGSWSSSGINIDSGDAYSINGTSVLNATTLGSGVTASSLTSLGTIASLVATTADINGGTVDAAAIGATTPSTGAFTTLTTTGNATFGNATSAISNITNGTASGTGGGALVLVQNGGGNVIGIGNYSAVAGGAYNATPTLYAASDLSVVRGGSTIATFTSTGLNSCAIGATTPSTGAFTTLSATGDVTLGDASGDTITANGTFGAIVSSSSIKSTSTSGGIGYATGAGGTVTQLTSKGTGVTLNKVTGQIVTHNANLNNATNVSFTFTNSSIAATDVVTVALSNGSSHTGGAYQIWVDGVRSGACDISIRNVSGGALAEAMTINFAVIKGVTS
jgi:hypothetical protein